MNVIVCEDMVISPVNATQDRMVPLLLIAAGLLVRSAEMHGPLTISLNDAARGILPEVWSAISLLGLGWATVILVCATDRSTQAGRQVLIALVLGGALTHLLKHWISDPRPGMALAESLQIIGVPILQGGSMPSGHTLAAFCMAKLLDDRLRARLQPYNRSTLHWARSGLWSLTALIGLSRVAVGAHWPADVLVGAGLGMLMGAASIHLARFWPEGLSGGFPALVISLEVIAAVLAITYDQGLQSTLWLQYLLAGLTLLSASERVLRWRSSKGVLQ
jgi:undecaprenyl-diphosphatase